MEVAEKQTASSGGDRRTAEVPEINLERPQCGEWWYVDVRMPAVEDTAASSQCTAVNPQQLEPVAPATPSSRPHNSFRALYKSSPAAAATAPTTTAGTEQVTAVKAANADTDNKAKIAELEAALTALDAPKPPDFAFWE